MIDRSTSRLRRLTALAGLAGLCALALLLTACGGGSADLANGKQKFSGTCGGCHTLADAGTKGTIGPNLDDAFRAPRREGFKSNDFESLVRYWIGNAQQRTQPIMQRNLVKGNDARDVAAYIAAVAGTDAESPARPEEATK